MFTLLFLTTALAASSQIELPGAVACYHDLKTALSIDTDYPAGYVITVGRVGKKSGAFVFTGTEAKFYEGLEATDDGEFMMLWDMGTPIDLPSNGKPAPAEAREKLAQRLLSRLGEAQKQVKPTKKAPETPDVMASLNKSLKGLKDRNDVSAPTPEGLKGPAGVAAMRARGENPAPMTPEQAAEGMENVVKRQNEAFDRLEQIPRPELKTSSASALQKALKTCAAVQGDKRVSDKAQKMLDALNSSIGGGAAAPNTTPAE